MSQKLFVRLSEADRARLNKMTRTGSGKAREITRARILLLADRNQEGRKTTQAQIAQALSVSPMTVSRTCRRFVLEGLEGKQNALKEKPRPGREPKITGQVEAQLVTLACSEPPEGKGRWTVRLLRDELVRLEVLESLSHVAVYNTLTKTRRSSGR